MNNKKQQQQQRLRRTQNEHQHRQQDMENKPIFLSRVHLFLAAICAFERYLTLMILSIE